MTGVSWYDARAFLERLEALTVSKLCLFWGTAGRPGTGPERNLTVDLPPDGQWHAVVFDLRGKPGWDGVVNLLRLDPEPADVGEGARVEIEWIEARAR
ncbi:MAG: hypothetical protein HYU66_11395 [Armatimonadetes bacterium]|nr:hypothetical protein [Armatimonadota bacterium]